jgi:hypothetical protein
MGFAGNTQKYPDEISKMHFLEGLKKNKSSVAVLIPLTFFRLKLTKNQGASQIWEKAPRPIHKKIN